MYQNTFSFGFGDLYNPRNDRHHQDVLWPLGRKAACFHCQLCSYRDHLHRVSGLGKMLPDLYLSYPNSASMSWINTLHSLFDFFFFFWLPEPGTCCKCGRPCARVCMRVSMCVCVCMCMCTHMPVSSCSACSCSQSWKSCLLKTWTWEGCYRGLCMAESSPWFLLLLIPLFLSALPAPVIFLVSGELHLTFISVQIYRQLITFFGWKYCYLAFFWKTASWTKSFRVTISFFPSVRGCFSLDCWLWYLMNHLPLLSLSSLMCNELTIPSPFLDAYNIFLFILGAQQRHQDCLGMVFLCLFCLEFAEFLESLDLDPI